MPNNVRCPTNENSVGFYVPCGAKDLTRGPGVKRLGEALRGGGVARGRICTADS